MSVFTLKEIQQKLELFQPNWKHQEQELILFLKFSSYQKTLDFVNDVAKIAIAQNHHPSMQVDYCEITLKLTTHDSGALSQKDFTLAKAIDDLLLQRS